MKKKARRVHEQLEEILEDIDEYLEKKDSGSDRNVPALWGNRETGSVDTPHDSP